MKPERSLRGTRPFDCRRAPLERPVSCPVNPIPLCVVCTPSPCGVRWPACRQGRFDGRGFRRCSAHGLLSTDAGFNLPVFAIIVGVCVARGMGLGPASASAQGRGRRVRANFRLSPAISCGILPWGYWPCAAPSQSEQGSFESPVSPLGRILTRCSLVTVFIF
jgi:hypothetical protein